MENFTENLFQHDFEDINYTETSNETEISNQNKDENCMVKITLNYNNHDFDTFVTQTFLKVLENDQTTLDSYAKMVYEREFVKRQKVDNTSFYNFDVENQPSTSAVVEEKFQWTQKSTLLLLQTRLTMEKDFIKPTSSKKKLWKTIKDILNKQNYKVTDSQCDSKYRNLLHTYRLNKKKQKTSGEENITWEYFEKFDQVLGHKDSSYQSQMNLGSTMPEINQSTGNERTVNQPEMVEDNTEVKETETLTETTNQINPTEQNVRKRKLEIMSMGRYLFLKNKRNEETEKKKEEFQKQKWTEEKELRKKEVETIDKLADAIRFSNQ